MIYVLHCFSRKFSVRYIQLCWYGNESKIKKIGQRLRFWETGVAKTRFSLQITRFTTQSNTGSSTNQY